ncbi:Na+/H+ antiporter NhaC family protein [Rhodohalobacter barkolensis]|uniref:Sodium:proton antiporter n=1 Tax=Rhodohalobacter barkolensis TaxID=2053187 RepID=A0A2N0VE27_9BACT|nr:Na+/H+ antiporter NhaC family protein [Rhodohalobacter barkolensis]PKD42447.1 sodium:proton antiporter [Rhodohalobacter barkolensis]
MSNFLEDTVQKWKTPEIRRRIYFGAFMALVIAGVYYALNWGSFPEQDGHFGFWSVMPPLVAILLAFWTREVVSALFIGIFLGGVIAGQLNIVQDFLIPSIGTESFALILLVYLWALGGLIGIWTRTGGAEVFAKWASEKMVVGPRSAKFFTWLMGLVFHQGGTISTVLTGATVRPIADKHKVSHEELSYMVDSTASPAATLIPFNVWPIYVAGLVLGTISIFETANDGIQFFLASLPYNFYAIFAILITLLFAIEKLPWIPGKKMRKAIERSRTKGTLDRKGATPMAADELTQSKIPSGYKPGLIDFFGPIGALLGIAIIPYLYTFFILGSDEPTLLIAEAFVLAVLAGIGIAIAKGMSLQVAINGFIDGCKGVTIGAIILALAVTLKEVADAVGTANYVVMMIGDLVWPAFLPGVLMILCMLIAFSTGTSWGTYAVVFPIAVPLAWAVVPEDIFFLQLCFAAVIGGSVMGDQCSPISDTTILSSLSTGCDLMDHVTTQLPIAIMAGVLAMISYAVMVVLFV